MAMFIGGPYDGREIEYDPAYLKRVSLPEVEDFEESMVVRDETGMSSWPHTYEADLSVNPPVYRYRA